MVRPAMNKNLLIAVIVTVLMVGAHIGVFWWFVCRSGQLKPPVAKPELPDESPVDK